MIVMVSETCAPTLSVAVSVTVWLPVSRKVMVDVAPVAEFAVVGPWVRHVIVTVPTPPDVADVNVTFDDPSTNVTVSPSTGEVI